VNNKTGVITVADCLTPGSKNCLDFETKQTYYLTYKVRTALSSNGESIPELMCVVTQGSTFGLWTLLDIPLYYVCEFQVSGQVAL
jgi:hypothetical protein